MANQLLERRTFLKMLGAGVGATLFPFPMAAMSSDTTNSFSLSNFKLGKPEGFCIKTGLLINCRMYSAKEMQAFD